MDRGRVSDGHAAVINRNRANERTMNEGFAISSTTRTKENTTETTFEKFAEFFARAYDN